MNPEPRETDSSPRVLAFTVAQRRALAVVVSIFIACLAIALVRNPAHVDDPMPAAGSRYDELVDRLDPNTADAATLSALPQLGPRRARDIVEYRDRQRAADPNRLVFKELDDLLRVRGIGQAMIKHLEPYLAFPTTRPTTAAS